MADENGIKSALNEIASAEKISAILNSADDENSELKAHHPSGGGEYSGGDNVKSYSEAPSEYHEKPNTAKNPPRFKDGRLDTRNMTAEQLADRYEAKGKPKSSASNTSEDENSVGENEDADRDDSETEDKEKGKLAKTKEAFEKAKDKINDFKNNIMDRAASREKWKQVLDKAQHDNNWEKNRLPKWRTKLLMRGSDDLEAKRALENFESGDKWIKKVARKRKMKVAAHGSLKAAEQTMEGIKAEREFMADDAKKIKRAKRKLILEKHPVGKAFTKLGLDKFINTEDGLFTKIFDPENSACMKSCSMKMIVLSLFGSGILGTILTLLFTF